MPTVHYSDSGLQPAAKIMVLSFTLQIKDSAKWNGWRSGGNTDSVISLKAITSVYNSTSYV